MHDRRAPVEPRGVVAALEHGAIVGLSATRLQPPGGEDAVEQGLHQNPLKTLIMPTEFLPSLSMFRPFWRWRVLDFGRSPMLSL